MTRGRRIGSAAGWAACYAALAAVCLAMLWILLTVAWRGIAAIRPETFVSVTRGTGGGLLNAIEGTVAIAIGTIALAVPFGVGAGIYSAEFGDTGWGRTIRFMTDVLVGVPSIVLGYFGYVTMVETLGWHFSIAAACITLAILCVPYICRTTELALKEVPVALREAAYAMGAGPATVTFRITMRVAFPAVLTGILLALAISVGETAPLLYTAGWSSYLWNGHVVNEPVAYLTYVIWAFINEPFRAANELAYAAALLVTGFVLVISLSSRLLLARRRP